MSWSVVGGATLAVLVTAAVLVAKRPSETRGILRWSSLALTVVVVLLVGPWTVSDSGASALFLLGVPVVAAVIPTVARLAGRESVVADAIGGMVMAAWGVLLGLGIGAAFIPGALLLLIAAGTGVAARQSRSV
jgi:hypothetical protein